MPHPSPGPLWPSDLPSSYPHSPGSQLKHQYTVTPDSYLYSGFLPSIRFLCFTAHLESLLGGLTGTSNMAVLVPCLDSILHTLSSPAPLHNGVTSSLLFMPTSRISLSSHCTSSPSGSPVNAVLKWTPNPTPPHRPPS